MCLRKFDLSYNFKKSFHFADNHYIQASSLKHHHYLYHHHHHKPQQ